MTPEENLAVFAVAVVCGLIAGWWIRNGPGQPRVVHPDPLPPGIDQTKAWKAWSDKLRSEEGGR